MSCAAETVVVAIDGSPFARQALDWYIAHFHKENNLVLLLHTIELPSVPTRDTFEAQEKAGKKKADELFETFLPILKENQVKYEFITHFEKPGEFIVQTAKDRSASYVVTGTRGLGKLRKTLLGSVSDYVLRNAQCPVLICRSEIDFTKKN